MKKEYIKPEMVAEEIILETMLLADSTGTDIGGGEKPSIPLSNGLREGRGTWGNLWDADEE